MSGRAGKFARGLGAVAAAAAWGCGTAPTQAPEGAATVVRVERLAWNREPEPDLYRVTFDERRSRQIALRLGRAQFPAAEFPLAAEIDELEEEAGRELRAKGLCPGSVQMVAPIHRDTARGVSAVFKCRRPLL